MCSTAFLPSAVYFGIVPKTLYIVKCNFLRLLLRQISKSLQRRGITLKYFTVFDLSSNSIAKSILSTKTGNRQSFNTNLFLVDEGEEGG